MVPSKNLGEQTLKIQIKDVCNTVQKTRMSSFGGCCSFSPHIAVIHTVVSPLLAAPSSTCGAVHSDAFSFSAYPAALVRLTRLHLLVCVYKGSCSDQILLHSVVMTLRLSVHSSQTLSGIRLEKRLTTRSLLLQLPSSTVSRLVSSR